MTEGGWVRGRALLNNWFPVAVAALVLVTGVGVVVTYGAHVDPGTHQEQRTVEEWEVEGSFEHRSTVRDAANLTPFETGSVVRNRTVYFQRIMPVLEGEFAFGSTGVEQGVNVTIDRQLAVRSVAETTRDEEPTVYWEDVRPLGMNRTSLDSGETATVPFRVNVTRTVIEAENVSEQLESPGEIESEILVTVLATPRRPDAETRRLTYSLPVGTDTGIYRVTNEQNAETFTQTQSVSVENDPGLLRRAGGPLLVAVGIAGVAGLLFGRSRDAFELTEAERAWLGYREDRADFDEWITRIRLPEEANALPVAEAATLGDLVDFAIDTDNSVIDEPGTPAYHVVHDGYRYTFEAPSPPAGAGKLRPTGVATPPDRQSSPEMDDEDPLTDGAGDEDSDAPE